jgi:hypothetical protein
MLQTGVSQTHYVGVPICSDGSVNSMFGFARINEINMLDLYLNRRPRRGIILIYQIILILETSYTILIARVNDQIILILEISYIILIARVSARGIGW